MGSPASRDPQFRCTPQSASGGLMRSSAPLVRPLHIGLDSSSLSLASPVVR